MDAIETKILTTEIEYRAAFAAWREGKAAFDAAYAASGATKNEVYATGIGIVEKLSARLARTERARARAVAA